MNFYICLLRCRDYIWSDAVYAASASPNFTHGNRDVSQGGVGFVQTLSLMANFGKLECMGGGFWNFCLSAVGLSVLCTADVHADKGNLQYLQWWGTNCDACGGASSNLCIKQPVDANVLSCVTALQNCTCSGIGVPSYACNYNNDNFTQ